MIYLILVLTIVNTILIFFFYKKQNRVNQQIIETLKTDTKEIEDISEENKQHIDDMLKMREMYESD
jgi:Na+/melibiose symporter-like transporter|tara:strand:+ start:980 stop:1177 length:198 start_codon:yes stop_codon:yes gene_type:complete